MTILDLRAEAQAHKPRLPYLPELQEMAIGTWRGRMINEHGSARVFEGLAKQLEQLGLDEADLDRVRSFAAEDRKHGVLCGAVVEALGGQALAPALEVVPFPNHDEVSLLEGALRNLISISCLSETIAVALIGAEREEMPEGNSKQCSPPSMPKSADTPTMAGACCPSCWPWGTTRYWIASVNICWWPLRIWSGMSSPISLQM